MWLACGVEAAAAVREGTGPLDIFDVFEAVRASHAAFTIDSGGPFLCVRGEHVRLCVVFMSGLAVDSQPHPPPTLSLPRTCCLF